MEHDYNKYVAKVLRFNDSPDENFHLWSVRVEAALESQALATALKNDAVDNTVDKKARAKTIAALENNPLREIQD